MHLLLTRAHTFTDDDDDDEVDVKDARAERINNIRDSARNGK